MKVLICVNKQKDKEFKVCQEIEAFFKANNVETDTEVLVNKDAKINKEKLEGADAVVVLGGDGTLMRVSKRCAKYNVPLLGVNTGHLGFLAQTGVDGIEETLTRLIKGDYVIEKRMMLNGRVYRGEDVVFDGEALNDVCINRAGVLQILNFDVCVNGLNLKSYSADGVIISTPTGSTGYNLSAGGPIVEPSADMILLTPICAHTFMNRSILFKHDDIVTILIGEPHDAITGQTVTASFDGFDNIELCKGDRVEISKSEMYAQFIQLNNVNFLETLNRKLREY